MPHLARGGVDAWYGYIRPERGMMGWGRIAGEA